MLRRLVVTVVLLAVFAAGLDYGLRVWAGLWVGDRTQEALHLSKRPSVSFGGLLFTPQVIHGHIDSATLESDDFKVRDVAFSHARLTFEDVRFQTGKLLLHHRGLVRVASGDGVLAMNGPDLTRAFRAAGVNVSIRISRGEILASGGSLPGQVTASATTDNGSLVLQASQAALAIRLPLPRLGHGITYTDVAVNGNEAELTVRVQGARLTRLVG